MKVFITESAEADLIAIGDYIQPHNPARAASFVEELINCCDALGAMPRAHPLVPRYERQGIRRCVHENYLIFYRVTEDLVEIIHILQGSRNFAAILSLDE